jgi:hypothetical protein
MKNTKRFFLAAVLLSTSAMANLAQPFAPMSEENPVHINGGINGGIGTGDLGFGLSDIGGGLGFAHRVGYDFFYGAAVNFGYLSTQSKVFTEEAKTKSAMNLDVELMARYLPEVAENFHFGLAFSLGYSRMFGENVKNWYESMNFGDLNFKVGPNLLYSFNENVAIYSGVNYTLSNIRFGAKDEAKDSSYLSGVEAPIGAWFALNDNAGLYVEANSRFKDFSKFKTSFREEFMLGVTFAL